MNAGENAAENAAEETAGNSAGDVSDERGSVRERLAAVDPAAAASALRERIYATLTGLSTVLILLTEAEHISPGGAASSLAVTMGALWAASVVADLVAHSTVSGDAVRGREARRILLVAGQAIEIAVVPVLAVSLAGTGVWSVRTGLIIAAVALGLTQVVVALIALRRSVIGTGRRLVIVAGELLLVGLVVVIKVLAH